MFGKFGKILKKVLDPGGFIFNDEVEPVTIKQDSSVSALPQTPTAADSSVANAAEEERRKRRAAAGANSTLLTGGSALAASAGKKTLLGG